MITTEENQKNRQTYSMKRFLFLCATTFALSMLATSCEDSGDLEDEYLPPSVGIDSSYSPNIVAVVPGYERVEVIWELNNSDNGKDILNSYIYWNGGKSVHEATIAKLEPVVYTNADESETSYYRQTFDISEGDYTFYVRNLDSDKFVSSASSTITASVYGPVAEALLMDREIKSASYDSNNIYRLTWDNESETCAGSSITYTKITGQIAYVESAADDDFADLFDATEDGEIIIDTKHLPSRTVSRSTTDDEDAKSLADVLGEDYLNVAKAGLDTISAPTATKQMLGDGTKFYYFTTWDELWELLEEWETDFRTDEQIEAGAEIVSYANSTSQGRIDNLARKSNVNLKMLPGRYVITQEMASDDRYKLMNTVYGMSQCVAIPITGNNNYIDFTDVVFVANTDALGTFSYELFHLYVIGDANTIVGGEFNNEGSAYDDPNKGETNVVVDGRSNLLLDTRVHVMGSKPYGYGELFGKGSTNTISHNKHCGVLVRGNFNIVKRCTLTSQSYGHLTFFQGGYRCEIVESKVTGSFSTTDAVWEEEGFGTSADLINFMTAYFYEVPKGYALPLTEDSYRTYTSGSYWMRDRSDYKFYQNLTDYTRADGTTLTYDSSGDTSTTVVDDDSDYEATTGERNTTECIIEDSEVVDGRGGVSFRLGSSNGPSDRPIKNITLRGAQGGISSRQSGTIENCRSDIKHGPTFGQAYDSDNSITADITFIPYVGEHYNYNGLARDNGTAAKIKGGSGLTLTFPVSTGGEYGELFYEDNSQVGTYSSGLNSGAYVQCAGNEMSYGELAEIQNSDFHSSTIYNESYYPLRLGNKTGVSGTTTSGKNVTFYVRIGSYITVEDAYGQRLAPTEADFKSVINRNTFKLHSEDDSSNTEVKLSDYSLINCPYGTKGVWVVKSIDMSVLRTTTFQSGRTGFPVYHTDLEAYIKELDNPATAGGSSGGVAGFEDGQSYD